MVCETAFALACFAVAAAVSSSVLTVASFNFPTFHVLHGHHPGETASFYFYQRALKMATPIRGIPPSIMWSAWKALKGTYGATVTVPGADLRDKWVLITGANNGVGREAAIQFAKSGANLVLACRQPPSYEIHPEQVVEECKPAAPRID